MFSEYIFFSFYFIKEATAPENRTLRPWIITLGHRPMYCTTKDNDDCKNLLDRVRVGLPPLFLFGLEDLFYDYGVDIEIWGHEHTYERSWPLYNYEVYNGSSKEPYTDPKAPVHLIIGSAVSFLTEITTTIILYIHI